LTLTYTSACTCTDAHTAAVTQVLAEPDSYVARVQARARRREERSQQSELNRAALDIQSCTFIPQTTPCPAYILRIAESVRAAETAAAAVAGANSSTAVSIKPDWR
jgi:hypothetical protein